MTIDVHGHDGPPLAATDPLRMADAPPIPVTVTVATTVRATPGRPENWRTLLLVGSVIGVALMWLVWLLVGWKWGIFVAGLALYEGWTLCNPYRDDTISEAVWFFNDRPIVALMGGGLICTAVWTGYLGEPNAAMRGVMIGACAGHFWWQRNGDTTVLVTPKEIAA